MGDRTLFPALKEIVVAGHSGGGQVVQRFALTGHDHPLLNTEGIRLRYVVANPSSYAYFSPQRPVKFDAASCPGFNDWKYGMQNLPGYVGDRGAQQLEQAYVSGISLTCWASRTPTPTIRRWIKAARPRPRARIG